MDMISMLLRALGSGWDGFVNYVTEHTLTCLVPALFIAGAIAAFAKKEKILKYLGPNVKKYISYPIAAVSGTVLAVCSCTILPLFAGIYKKGSGIGPAIAFLYSGPAINILAIVYTARVLGYDIGIARAVISISMSVVIGIIMATIFRAHDKKLVNEAKKTDRSVINGGPDQKAGWVYLAFFGSMIGILIIATAPMDWMIKFPIVYALTLGIAILLIYRFGKDEVTDWWRETWDLSKKIVPILVIGSFVVGIISYFLPPETFKPFLGGEGFLANLTAAVIGALLYMPTLLEVPIVGTTFGYSDGLMGNGPALALLLSGPAVSLPSIIVLYRIMGLKKTTTYILLVIVFSALAGFVYGNLIV